MLEDELMKAEYDDLMRIAKERYAIRNEIEVAQIRLAWLEKDIAIRENYFVLCDDGTVEIGLGCF